MGKAEGQKKVEHEQREMIIIIKKKINEEIGEIAVEIEDIK